MHFCPSLCDAAGGQKDQPPGAVISERGLRAYPLLMESKAGSNFLFYRASFRKTASHFSGRTLAADRRGVRLALAWHAAQVALALAAVFFLVLDGAPQSRVGDRFAPVRWFPCHVLSENGADAVEHLLEGQAVLRFKYSTPPWGCAD